MVLVINGEAPRIGSIRELDRAWVRSKQQPQFELWASIPNGPSMALLRNGIRTWLMYLRFSGDAGLVCPRGIDLELCYQAMMYFFVNDGAKPDWITWDNG